MIHKDFDSKSLNEIVKSGTVIIDFYAKWCGNCKMLTPELEKFLKNNEDVNVYIVDVDKDIKTARKYGIMSIPTLVLYKNGIIVNKIVGFRPYDEIEEWVEKS